MDMVNIKINGEELQRPGKIIQYLQAARQAGIDIPTLCYLKGHQRNRRLPHVPGRGEGCRSFGQAACVYPVNEGMEVFTEHRTRPREHGRTILELTLSNHEKKCLTCVRNQNCELQRLSEELNVY